jgi:hypothetical protein
MNLNNILENKNTEKVTEKGILGKYQQLAIDAGYGKHWNIIKIVSIVLTSLIILLLIISMIPKSNNKNYDDLQYQPQPQYQPPPQPPPQPQPQPQPQYQPQYQPQTQYQPR